MAPSGVLNVSKTSGRLRLCYAKVYLSGVSRVGLRGGGGSKSRKFKWLVKADACKGVTLLIKKNNCMYDRDTMRQLVFRRNSRPLSI